MYMFYTWFCYNFRAFAIKRYTENSLPLKEKYLRKTCETCSNVCIRRLLRYYGLNMAEGMQKRLQVELEKYQALQKDVQKAVTVRQKLDAQLNENTLVKEELDRLEEEAKVYKMVGPVLVKQELGEARANVQKRMDYINGELKRYDSSIKDLEKKQEAHKESLIKLQHQFQQAQVKAAAKS